MDTRVAALFALSFQAVACSPSVSSRPPGSPPLQVVLSPGGAEGGLPYRGEGACRRCHPRNYAFWEATGHAGSLRTLEKAGEERNPSCLRCHATGYGERTGYRPGRGDGELASVSCEACHGPSRDHADSRHPSLVSTPEDCDSCDVSRTCRLCHTSARAPEFSMEKALAAVSCGNVSPRGAGKAGSGPEGGR